MKNSTLMAFEKDNLSSQTHIHPKFRPGDSLRVHYKIEEQSKGDKGGKKYRIQIFEGVCIRYRKGGINSTFTVRKIGANSVGVERIFSYNSPLIAKIEISSPGKVRRASLYYLRDLSGKAARIRSRRVSSDFSFATVDPNAEQVSKKTKSKKSSKKK